MPPLRRLFVPSLVFVLLGLASVTVAGDEGAGGVKVETSRQLYEPGATVEITIVNERAGPISLPGCGSFDVQRFDVESYRSVVVENCVSEGEALLVQPGRFSLNFVPSSAQSGDILRLSVAYGWGCEERKPLSQARCKGFGTAVSSNFRVGKSSE